MFYRDDQWLFTQILHFTEFLSPTAGQNVNWVVCGVSWKAWRRQVELLRQQLRTLRGLSLRSNCAPGRLRSRNQESAAAADTTRLAPNLTRSTEVRRLKFLPTESGVNVAPISHIRTYVRTVCINFGSEPWRICLSNANLLLPVKHLYRVISSARGEKKGRLERR